MLKTQLESAQSRHSEYITCFTSGDLVGLAVKIDSTYRLIRF
jgi:hypothetical protein